MRPNSVRSLEAKNAGLARSQVKTDPGGSNLAFAEAYRISRRRGPTSGSAREQRGAQVQASNFLPPLRGLI